MIIGFVLCTVTGLLAAASCALSAIELGRIYDNNEEPLCANNGANNIRSQCKNKFNQSILQNLILI